MSAVPPVEGAVYIGYEIHVAQEMFRGRDRSDQAMAEAEPAVLHRPGVADQAAEILRLRSALEV